MTGTTAHVETIRQLTTLSQRGWELSEDGLSTTRGPRGFGVSAPSMTMERGEAELRVQPVIGPSDAGVMGYTAKVLSSGDDEDLYAVAQDGDASASVRRESQLPVSSHDGPWELVEHPELFASFDEAFEAAGLLAEQATRFGFA